MLNLERSGYDRCSSFQRGHVLGGGFKVINRFGGYWTRQKLQCLDDYLGAYLLALKNQSFTKGYIDAFAGTPVRHDRESSVDETEEKGGLTQDQLDFAWNQEEEQTQSSSEREREEYHAGSTQLALVHDFDGYIFIEKDRAKASELRNYYSDRGNVRVRCGGANEELQKIARNNDWRKRRAVCFLDPFGMQLDWETIEALATTKALDVWMLIPLGQAIMRMFPKKVEPGLPREETLHKGYAKKLDRFFGDQSWYDVIYKTVEVHDLFGTREEVKRGDMKDIEGYIMKRLRETFASGGVAEPGYLYSSQGNLLYLLCFASGNERGAKVACKIANHLIGKLNEDV